MTRTPHVAARAAARWHDTVGNSALNPLTARVTRAS